MKIMIRTRITFLGIIQVGLTPERINKKMQTDPVDKKYTIGIYYCIGRQ